MAPRSLAPAAGLLVVALGHAGLPASGASRPTTAGTGILAEVPHDVLREVDGTQLQSLVSQVHQTIESGLNSSYLHALQEERKYTALFSHLEEGLDNFTRNSRNLQARIPQERLGELRAIEDAFTVRTVPKVAQSLGAEAPIGGEGSGEDDLHGLQGQRPSPGAATRPPAPALGAEIGADGRQRPAGAAARALRGAEEGAAASGGTPSEGQLRTGLEYSGTTPVGTPVASLAPVKVSRTADATGGTIVAPDSAENMLDVESTPDLAARVSDAEAPGVVDAVDQSAERESGSSGAAPSTAAASTPTSQEGSEVLDVLEAMGE